MGRSHEIWRERYESQVDLIDRVVSFVCRRNGLRGDEADDFRGETHLRLIASDYAVLRSFDERSSLKTYLTVVVQRILLDYRTERWGKWRPSEAARRLGDDAVLLETLMVRDGHEFDEAVTMMQTNFQVAATRDELYGMTLSFPHRWGRSSTRSVPLDESIVDQERTPEQCAMDEEVLECERIIAEVLSDEVNAADPKERALLRMIHIDGHKVSSIARTLRMDQQQLYRKIHGFQRRVRLALDRRGLDWTRASRMFEACAPQRRLDLEKIFDGGPSNETGEHSSSSRARGREAEQ